MVSEFCTTQAEPISPSAPPFPMVKGWVIINGLFVGTLSIINELFPLFVPHRFTRPTVRFDEEVTASMVITLVLALPMKTVVIFVVAGGVPPLQFVPSRQRPLVGLVQSFCAGRLLVTRRINAPRAALEIRQRRAFCFMIPEIIAEISLNASPDIEKLFQPRLDFI